MDAQIEIKIIVAAGDVASGVAERLVASWSRQTRTNKVTGGRIRARLAVYRIANDVRAQSHAAQE